MEPGKLNDRLAVQQGKYNSGGKQYYSPPPPNGYANALLFSPPRELIELASNIKQGDNIEDQFVWCVKIPKESKQKIKEDLQLILGIDKSSLMLGLDNKGRVAAEIFSYKVAKKA